MTDIEKILSIFKSLEMKPELYMNEYGHGFILCAGRKFWYNKRGEIYRVVERKSA